MGNHVDWLMFQLFGQRPERTPRQKVRRGPPRDAEFRRWIRTKPCVACSSSWQVEAAHTGSDGGMSQKASDYSCVPLCRECHTAGFKAYHRVGRTEFERLHGLDFDTVAEALFTAWRPGHQLVHTSSFRT